MLAREAKDSRSGRMGGTMEGRVTLVRELSAKIVAEVWQTRILAMNWHNLCSSQPRGSTLAGKTRSRANPLSGSG